MKKIKTQFEKTQIDFHRTADRRRFENRVSNPFIRSRERRLSDALASAFGHNARKILEIGCGEASNYLYLREVIPSMRYCGADFSLPKLHFAKKAFPEILTVQADALDLPFPDDSFDGVFCRDMVHHVNHARSRLLSEAVRVTRSGGMTAIIEGNGGTFLNQFFAMLFPAERGMRYSKPEFLLAECNSWGEARLQFMEASQLVRAIGFLFGWPQGLQSLLWPIYYFADLIERFVYRIVPRQWWAYYIITIRVS